MFASYFVGFSYLHVDFATVSVYRVFMLTAQDRSRRTTFIIQFKYPLNAFAVERIAKMAFCTLKTERHREQVNLPEEYMLHIPMNEAYLNQFRLVIYIYIYMCLSRKVDL